MGKIKYPKMLRNSLAGVLASLISTVSLYIIRYALSHVLGDEIYGINSIFVSIVGTFLILELGLSTAMIIVMYKPVADNDLEKIKSILCLYKKFYRIFCVVLFVLGVVVCVFFLEGFVNTSLDFRYVRLYFMLYLFSIICKYLWSYKSCILYANKQNNVVSLVSVIVNLLFTVLEVVCIVKWKNFSLYLILFLLQNIALNAACNIYANKHYPYILEKNPAPLDNESRKKLFDIIRPMFVQRMATQVQDASCVMVLGAVGTSAVTVGFFSNYILVVHACQIIFNQIATAFTTSFGSFSASNDDSSRRYKYYQISRFYMSWISIVFAAMYLCLIQPFIAIYFGAEFCMQDSMAVLFSFYVFLVLNSSVNLAIQNALGAHYLDTREMVIQAVACVVSSVLLGKLLGAFGVGLGLLSSYAIFTGVIKGAKIIRHVFHGKIGEHIFLLCKELLCFVLVAGTSYLLSIFVLKPQGLLGLLVSALAVFAVANAELLLINIRSDNLTSFKSLIKSLMNGKAARQIDNADK